MQLRDRKYFWLLLIQMNGLEFYYSSNKTKLTLDGFIDLLILKEPSDSNGLKEGGSGGNICRAVA